jgi:predicted nucleic acid-binding protein
MADREISKMKVLVDTNVVIDVLLKQTHFYKDSFAVFKLSDSGHICGVVAAISMTNAFFILRKAGKSSVEVYQDLDDISNIFKVAPLTESTIANALALRWKDFEDAVQFISAKESKVDFIITRNKADYKTSDIPCMTPTEFIAFLKEKEDAAENDNSPRQ